MTQDPADPKILADVMHLIAFESIYETVADKYGERIAVPLLAEIMEHALQKMVEREMVPFDISEGYADIFAKCYTLLEPFGFSFDEEILLDTPERFSARVMECPHIEYTKKNQHNCAACLGMKMGAFNIVTNKQPAFLVNTINLDDSLPLTEKRSLVDSEFEEKHAPHGRATIGILQRMSTGAPDCTFYIRVPKLSKE